MILISRQPSKIICLVFTCLMGAGSPALSDPLYQGTFVEQITSTEDTNLYYVGETFSGYYQYTAGSSNGSAVTAGYPGSGNWTNFTLDGSIFLPFSKNTTFNFGGVTNIQYTYGPGGEQIDLTQSGNGGAMTFQGNHVTGFDWSYDQGGFHFDIGIGTNGMGTFEALSFYDTPGGLTTSGAVQFGDPVVIPEPGVTVLFLAGLAGMAAWRRRDRMASGGSGYPKCAPLATQPASNLRTRVRGVAGGIPE